MGSRASRGEHEWLLGRWKARVIFVVENLFVARRWDVELPEPSPATQTVPFIIIDYAHIIASPWSRSWALCRDTGLPATWTGTDAFRIGRSSALEVAKHYTYD